MAGPVSDFPVPALAERARACAKRLATADRVLILCHDDADGLTSGAIAAAALERADRSHDVTVVGRLDADVLEGISLVEYDVLYCTDIGSGQADQVAAATDRAGITPVVADHHQPVDAGIAHHCNPLLEGLDGATECSGAGASYLVARALAETVDTVNSRAVTGVSPDARNRDLAALAIVGAAGDRQADGGELTGANRAIADDAQAAGALDSGRGLSVYGTETRPLPKLLAFAGEVSIPGISNDPDGAARFLDGVGAPVRQNGEWRRWVDLDPADQQTVASALIKRALRAGVPADAVDRLVGTIFTLPGAPTGTELRNATEFATLLNATARYDRPEVGLAVCLGDRDGALAAARSLLHNHRRNLSQGLDYVREHGVTREEHLQWFHAGDEIRHSIVGIVAGMAVGTEGIDGSIPIIAFARENDERVKVSARGTGSLVNRGLDLGEVMTTVAGAVGGEGGGHDVAAGASIPEGTESTFVHRADALVGDQLA